MTVPFISDFLSFVFVSSIDVTIASGQVRKCPEGTKGSFNIELAENSRELVNIRSNNIEQPFRIFGTLY